MHVKELIKSSVCMLEEFLLQHVVSVLLQISALLHVVCTGIYA